MPVNASFPGENILVDKVYLQKSLVFPSFNFYNNVDYFSTSNKWTQLKTFSEK